MTTEYTLFNEISKPEYSVKVSKKFLNSCNVLKNLFEDVEIQHDEIIPIPIYYSKNEVQMYIDFFEAMIKLKVKNNAGQEVNYLDYISKFREEYIENYTNKNLDPPHLDEVYKIFNSLGIENIRIIFGLDGYFNNNKIIKGLMLCIVISIRKMDYGKEENETEKNFKERQQKSANYIKAITECIN
jgi:hypothetical protein